METITLTKKERILIFFTEYYFGVSTMISIFRLIGGPVMFYAGLTLYQDAVDRFGIGYGGIMIAFSVYYTFKPFWWVLIKWKYYKTVEFQLEAAADKFILKEGESASQTEYSKFENIIKRKTYFVLRIQKGLKIYLPIKKLSIETIKTLSEKER